MTLLAPLFLFGLALLTLPWWLHRLQTEIQETESFPSTMLLEAAKKRVHVRKKLRYLLLMAARILFLCLLVFAFARPAYEPKATAIDTTSPVHLIVLDTSASMTAADNIGSARTTADRILSSIDSGDQAVLMTADTLLTKITDISPDLSLVRNAISNIEARPVAAEFSEILQGIDNFMQSNNLYYHVHIISDFQASAMPSRFSDLIPTGNAQSYELHLHPINISQQDNVAIESVTRERNGIRVALRSWRNQSKTVQLTIEVNDQSRTTAELELPADGRASVVIPNLEFATGANEIVVELLEEDTLSADNRYHFALDLSPAQPVLLLSSNTSGLASTYLAAIFSDDQSANRSSTGFSLQQENINNFDSRLLERYPWIIIEDLASVSNELASTLESYLNSGGSIFAASGRQSMTANEIPLTQHRVQAIQLAPDKPFLSISSIDQTHPVLNKLDGWSNITVTEHVPIDVQSQDLVLLGLSNGKPLLIERNIGRGRLLWLTSSLNNDWNDLPVKPLFVGLMGEISAYLSNTEQLDTQRFSGQSLGINRAQASVGQLIDPTGKKVLKLGETPGNQQLRLDQTGFYRALSSSGEQLIAVNIDPIESDLKAINATKLESWRETANREPVASVQASAEQIENKVKPNEIWFLLFALASCILFIESILANVFLKPVEPEVS